MAAASEAQAGPPQTSQDILGQVRKFIRGANYEEKVSGEELCQSALYLLRTLPAARHAVLEYLCNVFTEAVNSHLLHLQLETTVADEDGVKFDNIIQNASGVLLNFVRSNPAAWAPIISSWSLELLGQISRKYSQRHGVPHSDSLNEVLQLWMTCGATKALIEIATECFDAMVCGAPDVCVDSLLEASVKYSPYFDWVVAHIGSCFPKTIIARVLMCGLKDFCTHGGGQSESTSSATSEDKTPKMASVVGILGHLASKHGQDIRRSLMTLFQESLTAENDPRKLSTVPFLLQLASMSPMLLQVLTTDFLKALTPEVVNKLREQFSQWHSLNLGDYDSLLSLCVHLVMKSDVGAHQVLQFLLDVAFPSPQSAGSMQTEGYHPQVQTICLSVLEQLTSDLQKAVFNRRQSSQGIPFLASLSSCSTDLTRQLLNADNQSSEWIVRILGYICLYNDVGCASTVLCQIMTEAQTPKQVSRFIHLQTFLETRMSKILRATVDKIVDALQPSRGINKAEVLRNLLYVVKWEKRPTAQESESVRCLLHTALQPHITLFSSLLNHPDDNIAVATLELVQVMGIPRSLQSNVLLHLCHSLTSILFRAFGNPSAKQAGKVVRLTKTCVNALCAQPCAQSLILKGLIEGSLAPETRELFGGKIDLTTAKAPAPSPVSLFEENCKHGVSMTLPQSHSSVFHAGIIGRGLKPREKPSSFSKDQIQRNKSHLLDVLWLASSIVSVSHYHGSGDAVSMETDSGEVNTRGSGPSPTLSRKIAGMLVHLVTPDVLYNSIAWPEEDFLRATIERDLHVFKQFEENPVLWDVMELWSTSQMFACFCSPVLRSLTATLIIHFENARDKSARNSPKQLEYARRVVYCLKRGNMLPSPLGMIGEIFQDLSPFEVHLLLLNSWRYIKENPPQLDGPPRECDSHYLDVLRAVLHKNIGKLGHHYSRMFDIANSTAS
ncbi:integrator complex subunit 5-like [Liolophura sinensis]|uniref:integrator complex subunit 5-like n=1 Tax=Liolophura sinensis TaxID=3198878 RepID=UPI0031593564